MKILIGLILLPVLTIGQSTYTGSVINKNNLSKIPYATIGLIKENTGINADENGDFSLPSVNTRPNDTLVFSSVGYEALKVPVDKLPGEMKFYLEEKKNILDELLVKTRLHWTFTTLNDFSNCGTNYFAMAGYETQVAQHFHSDTDHFILKEIEVCKYAIALIDPDKCKFRIRIYGMNPINGAPTIDLTDSIIEVKTGERRTNINVEKYKINIDRKDFYIAVEWLKIPYNASNEKVKINGKRIKYISYSPLLAFQNNGFKSRDNNLREVWLRNYRGQWLPLDYASKLMISAVIKY